MFQDLFLTAQKQIYNLMKLDSFSRFLKSDVYKESLLADMAGSPLPFDGSDLEPELQTSPLDLNQVVCSKCNRIDTDAIHSHHRQLNTQST